MPTYIKTTIIFESEEEAEHLDLDALADGIIDLLESKFPGYSGSCITVGLVDENGDAINFPEQAFKVTQ